MIQQVIVDGRPVRLDPAALLGSGGEADVYRLPEGAMKIYKPPNHPALTGNVAEQTGARLRLQLAQNKLPSFPKGLPSRVIVPRKLAYDSAGEVVGYVMDFLPDTEPLKSLSLPNYAKGLIAPEQVMQLFAGLHMTVADVHTKGVVFGDFNDLNVLVKDNEAYVIDADSAQYGSFPCTVFTARFVDPLHCKESGGQLDLFKHHTDLTDWYAFAVMLMQSLLYIDPYGGTYKPRDKSKRLPHPLRPLHRVTVFDPEVVYPKAAMPLDSLPAVLIDLFREIFIEDRRGVFPEKLLDPAVLQGVVPQHLVIIQKETVTGNVTMRLVIQTTGRIVASAMQNKKMRWVVHEDGAFSREDGSIVLAGELDARMRFAINGERTIVARGGQLALLDESGRPTEQRQIDAVGGAIPVVTANSQYRYWVQDGQLMRSDELAGTRTIGRTLTNQTLLWVGEEFGLGFYRIGGLQQAFLFDAERAGINDNITLEVIPGQQTDAWCAFSDKRVWFFVAYQDAGRSYRRVTVLDRSGQVLASETIEERPDHWLGTNRNGAAVGNYLLVATDDGIQRIELSGGTMQVAAEFPDTAQYVTDASKLYASSDGLFVVNPESIVRLAIN